MPILKYEFCAPSEAFLFLPSLELTYICLFLLWLHLFHIPHMAQNIFWCIQNRCCFQTDSWPSFKGVLRETVLLPTSWWHFCCTDCRFQCKDLVFYVCQGRLSTIYVVWEWTNVCRHFSVSRYAPCWVLNVWPVAWMACKSKRFTLLLPQFRIWQVGLAPAARGGGNPSGIEWYPRATPPVPCIVSSYTERKRRVAVIGDCLLRGMEGLMYRPETTTGKSAISQGLG